VNKMSEKAEKIRTSTSTLRASSGILTSLSLLESSLFDTRYCVKESREGYSGLVTSISRSSVGVRVAWTNFSR